jgi:fatty-acyl-CoA synthase
MNSWREETQTFGALPAYAARRFGEAEGLLFEGKRYSFVEINAEVDLAARALMAAGVNAGDHVALWLNNSDDWIFIAFAILKIGAVAVPINTRFRTHDLDYVLCQADSAFLITNDVSGPIDYLAMVKEVVKLPEAGDAIDDPSFPMLRKVIIRGDGAHQGVASWDGLKAAASSVSLEALNERAAAVQPSDTALIMYTSGTTGFPKGAVHTHVAIRSIEERASRMAITPRDAIMGYLPLFHMFGFAETALMPFVSGARHIIMETYSPADVLDLIEAERATIIHGFEAHVKTLCEEQEPRPRDISSLRTGIFAAGQKSATPVLYRAAETLAPIKPVSGFGMTEIWIGSGLTALDDSDERRYESSGYPGLGFELRVADLETGAPLGVGVEGELQVRGRYLMQSYYKKPDETAAAYSEDGWFKTGDAAIWRDDGYVRFLGRYKDMLKVGGENVDPMEVEGLLLAHPDICQTAIVGCPDETMGEIAIAYVQLEPGADMSAEDVAAYCKGKVASFKLPKQVVFLDDFPMTASGKIRKVELRADATERFAK